MCSYRDDMWDSVSAIGFCSVRPYFHTVEKAKWVTYEEVQT